MAVTINEVAKRAGVSIATVSRVINGVDSVNPRMRERVLEAITELGYVPNSIAQSLKQNCSKTIGITVSDLSVAFFAEVIKGVEKTFLPQGYATIISSTYDDPKNERTILQHMMARRVDALLVNSTGANERLLAQVVASGTPVILYDRRPRGNMFPSVYANKQRGVYISLEHLMALGHRRIMLATGPKRLSSNYDRYIGVQEFIFDSGLDPADFSFRFGEFSFAQGVSLMEELMRMERRPTAVITGSIAITAGIMQFCREKGVRIPEDIAIVSSGNFLYGDVMGARLTYMDDCIPALSASVVALLERCLTGGPPAPDYQEILEQTLHIGESTIGRSEG